MSVGCLLKQTGPARKLLDLSLPGRKGWGPKAKARDNTRTPPSTQTLLRSRSALPGSRRVEVVPSATGVFKVKFLESWETLGSWRQFPLPKETQFCEKRQTDDERQVGNQPRDWRLDFSSSALLQNTHTQSSEDRIRPACDGGY